VAAFVHRMGGSFEDARDIFHDALVLYFEALSQKDCKIRTSEEAYILGIAKHLWIRKHNNQNNNIPLTELENRISVPDDFYPSVESMRLLRFLKSAGKKCMDLLRSFYYEPASVKTLAVKLGYPNEHSLSVQKYKCLEKVRDTIKQKSLSYEDFIE
jgi:DNA-directed RNA polymerase specialized sigma24 family protein